MDKNIDKRTIRTRRAITVAFTELMLEKDYEDITVTELADRAQINRKTFYAHYECLDDVLYELQIGIAERVIEIYKKNNKGMFDIDAFTNTLNDMLNENYNLYRRLVVANSYRFFSRSIKDNIKEAVMEQFSASLNVDKVVLNLVAEYCVSGMFKVYKVWFDEGANIDKQKLAKLVSVLTWGAIKSVMAEEDFKKQ